MSLLRPLRALALVVAALASAVGAEAQRSRKGYVVTADSLRLFYRVAGTAADTVIAVHGGPGVDLESIYRDFLPLAKRHTVIFYDQRGTGRSTLPADSTQLTAAKQVHDLDAVRRHFGLQRVTLVAHSYGPLLAATYAIAHPGVVDRMVFFGPVPPRRGEFPQRFARETDARLHRSDRQWLDHATRGLADTSLDDWTARRHCRNYWAIQLGLRVVEKPRFIQRIIRSDFCASDVRGIRFGLARTNGLVMASYGDWDLRTQLASVPARTLIVHGTEEMIPMELVEEWVGALPNATLLPVPRAAHFTYAERPEIVWPAVEQFLVRPR